MDLASPISSVIPSVHGVVLEVLGRTDVPLSGRRTAELTNGRASRRRVDAVLQQLAEAGVVVREHHPPVILYRLNREHLAAPAIVALANLRDRLIDRISALVEQWDPAPVAVWLFGSLARSDGSPASDIDVLVLRSDLVSPDDGSWLQQMDALSAAVTAWTGNGCEVLEYSETQFATVVANDARLVHELRTDALRIAGDLVEHSTRAPASG